MYQILAYFKFLWRSKNEHSVHSPFVFNLITKCFYDRKKHSFYSLFYSYRQKILQNKETIQVTDFGAGSRTFKSNIRKVSAIAKNAGVSRKNGELLSRVTHYFKPNSILEIGTSLGLGTVALHAGHPHSKITTLEGCQSTASIAKNMLEAFNIDNISIKIGEFSNTINHAKTTKLDLIYFDGNHSYDATLNYFEQLLDTVNNNTIFIFDDIHWSKEMDKAWAEIKKHPEVTITIDTFYHGFVFFRKEHIEKEHFVIRI